MAKIDESWTLFFDESGTFDEPGLVAGPTGTSGGRGASQLVGVLVPPVRSVGAGDPLARLELDAKEVLDAAYRASGFPPDWTEGGFHATEIVRRATQGAGFPRKKYGRLLSEAVRGIQLCSWQPVRLVNLERTGFGDRFATYANMAAELVVQALEALAARGQQHVALKVIPARYYDPKRKMTLPVDAYERRIGERIAFCAVRRGRAATIRPGSIAVKLGSGRNEPVLQLCDLLSNASFRNFGNAKHARRGDVLKEAFAEFDFTLQVAAPLERIIQLSGDGLYGLALREIAEARADPSIDGGLRARIVRHEEGTLERLARLAAPARDPHLSVLASWLEQIVAEQRAGDRGLRAAAALRKMADALRNRVPDGEGGTVDWFRFACRRWELTAANHAGDLQAGQDASAALEGLMGSLAGRWEHGPLLIGAMVVQAVHLTDVFEHERAAARCRAVVDYHVTLRELFHRALPQAYGPDLRSDQLGKALGTWLQAAWIPIAAGVASADEIAVVRELSERAMAEFEREADLRQQYQYRAQLETFAGDFAAAREYLGRSLGLGTGKHDHAALAAAIAALDGIARGFAVAHWLRIGARAAMAGDRQEVEAVFGALPGQGFWRLCSETVHQLQSYPVHGILRSAAALAAWAGETDQALRFVAAFRRGEPVNNRRPVFAAIFAAMLLETAAFLWLPERHEAESLLGELAKILHAQGGKPVLSVALQGWDQPVCEVLDGKVAGDQVAGVLFSLSRRIPY